MPRLDTRALLEERAVALQRYFGKRGEYSEGNIGFPSAPYRCSVSYVSRRSIMSTNYFLSLSAEIPCPEAAGGNGACFLNRMGKWKLKRRRSNAVMNAVQERLRTDAAVTELSKKTDLDSIVVTLENGSITVRTNLYGGGFSAIMIPPIRFKVGIAKDQLARGAQLLTTLVDAVRPACQAKAG